MTVERVIFVRTPIELAEEFTILQTKAEAALRRAEKLPPGDSSEVARFETLSAHIERRAIAYAAANPQSSLIAEQGPESSICVIPPGSAVAVDGNLPGDVRRWLSEGAYVVMAALPHVVGETEVESTPAGPSVPAEPWKSTNRNRSSAESERFEVQIQRALASKNATASINPSAVSNRVLTETLRRYVHAAPGDTRQDVPVTYRDGSTADPFPFHALDLSDAAPPSLPILRFTLLSVRHVEMDELVDGAWFRNARISLNRPAGLTDADAFEISLKQLAQMRKKGPMVIEMFQTGLQPAVMGFYRAVVHTLIDYPGSIYVVPRYFAGEEFDYEKGAPWQTI